jgi:hypothetical protein
LLGQLFAVEELAEGARRSTSPQSPRRRAYRPRPSFAVRMCGTNSVPDSPCALVLLGGVCGPCAVRSRTGHCSEPGIAGRGVGSPVTAAGAAAERVTSSANRREAEQALQRQAELAYRRLA